MTRVCDLIPGDLMESPALGMWAVFVKREPHPDYPGLERVHWRMGDGSWSLDALHAEQVLPMGEVVASTDEERERRLRVASHDRDGADQ